MHLGLAEVDRIRDTAYKRTVCQTCHPLIVNRASSTGSAIVLERASGHSERATYCEDGASSSVGVVIFERTLSDRERACVVQDCAPAVPGNLESGNVPSKSAPGYVQSAAVAVIDSTAAEGKRHVVLLAGAIVGKDTVGDVYRASAGVLNA